MRRHRSKGSVASSLAFLRQLVCLFVLAGSTLDAPAAELSDPVSRYLSALAATLPECAQHALERIETADRKLLAARSYVKSGDQLIDRWSWTARQIREAEQSSEYRRMLASIRAVTDEFEAQNPGFTLYANTQVRTLELQLERWNINPRVGSIASELRNALVREMRTHGLPAEPDEQSIQRLKTFLTQWYPSTPAPLAAPGLSAHGQLRAIDFQIVKAGRVIAGTSIASVAHAWERPGWHDKLRRAIQSAGAEFAGPLRMPNEPWHYTYLWSTQMARATTAP